MFVRIKYAISMGEKGQNRRRNAGHREGGRKRQQRARERDSESERGTDRIEIVIGKRERCNENKKEPQPGLNNNV